MKMLPLLEDLAVSAAAGYIGTKAMEPVGMKLYELESKADRDREDAAHPGPPYEIAAKKIAALAGVTLEGQALDRASLAAHYGLALLWSPLYLLLRRRTSLRPLTAGLTTGAAMSAIADEWMTPALGSAPRTAPTRSVPTCAESPRTWSSGSGSPPAPRLCGLLGDAGHDMREATS